MLIKAYSAPSSVQKPPLVNTDTSVLKLSLSLSKAFFLEGCDAIFGLGHFQKFRLTKLSLTVMTLTFIGRISSVTRVFCHSSNSFSVFDQVLLTNALLEKRRSIVEGSLVLFLKKLEATTVFQHQLLLDFHRSF